MSVPQPDGLTAHELLQDLRHIKLSKRDREYVMACVEARAVGGGLLPPEAMTKLRRIFSRNASKIEVLRIAQEMAQRSMARERNPNLVQADAAVDEEDFGF